jgi:protein TonB
MSVGAHLVVFAALAIPGAWRRAPTDGPILPALYLYAPDRRPAAPREWRLPIPAPPGLPDMLAPGTTAEIAPGLSTPVRRESEGLTPLGPPAASFDSVYAAIDVDSEVVRFDWSVAPAYPDSLRQEGTEGYVEAEFVVDTTGRVDLETVRILTSTHWEFANSVRDALPGMLFRPAWRGIRKVRQLVGQRFAFRLVRPPVTTSSL